jgi:hypothetical protein
MAPATQSCSASVAKVSTKYPLDSPKGHHATITPTLVASNDQYSRPTIDTFPIRSYHPPLMWSKRQTLQFTIKLGLRKGLAPIRGMRRPSAATPHETNAPSAVQQRLAVAAPPPKSVSHAPFKTRVRLLQNARFQFPKFVRSALSKFIPLIPLLCAVMYPRLNAAYDPNRTLRSATVISRIPRIAMPPP